MDFTVSHKNSGLRLDLFIVIATDKFSRIKVREILNEGLIKVGENIEYRPHYKVKEGDKIHIDVEKFEGTKKVSDEFKIVPEKMDLDILFEDDDLVVINKPAGIVTHPATGNWNGTLLNGLFYHFKSLKNVGDNIRSGLIHRLDKDTSGLVLVGKTGKGLWYYSKLFAEREISKTYLAIIVGNIEESFSKSTELVVRDFLGRNPKRRTKISSVEEYRGKFAESSVVLIRKFNFGNRLAALVKVLPKTGRTHQIRVHLSKLGCPILGDPIYGKNNRYKRLMLHAWKLKLMCIDGVEREFEAPIPEEYKELTNV